MSNSSYLTALKYLCSSLGLEHCTQDWAIIVADSRRIDEFICFYENHTELTQWSRRLLFELIVASVSDGLDLKALSIAQLKIYGDFVKSNADKYPAEFNYWSSLIREDDLFTIGEWLKQINK